MQPTSMEYLINSKCNKENFWLLKYCIYLIKVHIKILALSSNQSQKMLIAYLNSQINLGFIMIILKQLKPNYVELL